MSLIESTVCPFKWQRLYRTAESSEHDLSKLQHAPALIPETGHKTAYGWCAHITHTCKHIKLACVAYLLSSNCDEEKSRFKSQIAFEAQAKSTRTTLAQYNPCPLLPLAACTTCCWLCCCVASVTTPCLGSSEKTCKRPAQLECKEPCGQHFELLKM